MRDKMNKKLLKTQLVFMTILNVLFIIFLSDGIKLFDVIKNSFLILMMTLLFNVGIFSILQAKESPMYRPEKTNLSLVVLIMKSMRLCFKVIFVLAIILSFIAGIGIFTSDVSINSFHIFLLSISFWYVIMRQLDYLIEKIR
jgi:hypothetical protein